MQVTVRWHYTWAVGHMHTHALCKINLHLESPEQDTWMQQHINDKWGSNVSSIKPHEVPQVAGQKNDFILHFAKPSEFHGFAEKLNLLNWFHSKMKEQRFTSELLILPLIPKLLAQTWFVVAGVLLSHCQCESCGLVAASCNHAWYVCPWH